MSIQVIDRRGPARDRALEASRLTPQASYGLYEGGVIPSNGDTDPIFTYRVYDLSMTLSIWEWRTMLSAGRYLFANVEMISGALEEMLRYAFPLHCQYTGPDKAWKPYAERWLRNWHSHMSLGGPVFDYHACTELLILGRKVDGDISTVYTRDRRGRPAIQLLRAHRIGTKTGVSTAGIHKELVRGGEFDGYLLSNGVIHDEFLTPVGYRVLSGYPESESDRSAAGIRMDFRAQYPDQIRGISELAKCIRTSQDLKRWKEAENRAQVIQSQYAITENNETGEAEDGGMLTSGSSQTTTTPGQFASEVKENGLIRYFRAGSGSAINLLAPNRPGDGSQKWWEKQVKMALYSIGWDADFALAISQPGGAQARVIIERCRHTVYECQESAVRWSGQTNAYGLGCAIQDREIPEPIDADWMTNWTFVGPKRITADTGNEDGARREAYKLGTRTLLTECAENGDYWTEHRDQKELETEDLLTRADRIQAKHPEWAKEQILNLLEQRQPNGVPPSPVEAEPKLKEDAEDE